MGSPAFGDALLGRSSPFSLNDVYDAIADDLAAAGFKVHRNPLVHRPTEGGSFTVAELREFAARPENAELIPAIDELVAAGAADSTA